VRQRAVCTGDAVLSGVRTVPPAGDAFEDEAPNMARPATANPARMSERMYFLLEVVTPRRSIETVL
jgi:hypothetical protein